MILNGKKTYNVLVVDDEPGMCLSLKKLLETEGFNIFIANDANKGLEIIDQIKSIDLILSDIVMPNMSGIVFIKKIKKKIPIILMTAYASLDGARNAFKLGVIDYLVKPFNFNELLVLIKQNLPLYEDFKLKEPYIYSFFKNNKYQTNLRLAEKFAKTNIPVLIQGESGTGKELIAKHIVDVSNRANKPFICINCAAIPESLLESELFGYEKGAFTGANDRKIGKIEQAKNGTLFLDEIGDMTDSLQAKMLRFLEDFKFTPIGSSKLITVDIRIITATNKDLIKMIKENKFRLDLYHRINGVNLIMPSLNELKDDIEELANFFIHLFNKKYNKNILKIDRKVLNYLKNYQWQGNIREFKNCIERCVVICDNREITEENLPDRIIEYSKEVYIDTESNQKQNIDIAFDDYDKKFMKKIIIEALTKSEGNKEKAAKLLKISRKTLYTRIKELNISNYYK